MKNRFITIMAIIAAAFLLGAYSSVQAQARSTGIGLRGSYWNMNDGPAHIIVTDHDEYQAVDVGNGGGWIFFFSRIDEQTFFEFGLGAVGNVKSERRHDFGEDVEVTAITPVLLGFRHNLFSLYSPSALQPYVAYGAGPYWLHDITVHERFYGDEALVKTKIKPGAYAGGGMNFMAASWFGLNFDVKYHFIDFNVNHDYSGFEYGLGFSFMWGRYKSGRRR
jgi:hypothetical protein